MYCVTEQQIDFILNDMRRRGLEMEDLQLNLLDHVCCIAEQNLKDGDDFESFYQKTIKQFFKHELWEIEEETITLLTFKNYYAMKKTMIVSGATAVGLLLMGSFLKIMHWPGAGMCLVLGISLISFLFLPLMLILKNREASTRRDKIIISMGTLIGILLCMSTLFKIMHWPGASLLWISTSAISIFILIPVYFFTGIRNPLTKVNTIVTSIILVGATGLLFTLTSLRKSSKLTFLETKTYYKNQQLLQNMKSKVVIDEAGKKEFNDIQNICEKLKELIIRSETGLPALPADFESKNIVIYEGGLGDEFMENGEAVKSISELKKLISKYNLKAGNTGNLLDYTIFEGSSEGIFIYSNLAVLNALTQIQMGLVTSNINPAIVSK